MLILVLALMFLIRLLLGQKVSEPFVDDIGVRLCSRRSAVITADVAVVGIVHSRGCFRCSRGWVASPQSGDRGG
jgi:hypothetical protein